MIHEQLIIVVWKMVPLRKKLEITLKRVKILNVEWRQWIYNLGIIFLTILLVYFQFSWFLFLRVGFLDKLSLILNTGFFLLFLDSRFFWLNFPHKELFVSFVGFDDVFNSWKLYTNNLRCKLHRIFFVHYQINQLKFLLK